MIKRILAAMGIALICTGAWAQCSTHTIFGSNGRTVICTTCCYGSNCTTNCF